MGVNVLAKKINMTTKVILSVLTMKNKCFIMKVSKILDIDNNISRKGVKNEV